MRPPVGRQYPAPASAAPQGIGRGGEPDPRRRRDLRPTLLLALLASCAADNPGTAAQPASATPTVQGLRLGAATVGFDGWFDGAEERLGMPALADRRCVAPLPSGGCARGPAWSFDGVDAWWTEAGDTWRQGFTVRAASDRFVRLHIGLEGATWQDIARDGATARTADGQEIVYGGLRAWAADNRPVAVHLERGLDLVADHMVRLFGVWPRRRGRRLPLTMKVIINGDAGATMPSPLPTDRPLTDAEFLDLTTTADALGISLLWATDDARAARPWPVGAGAPARLRARWVGRLCRCGAAWSVRLVDASGAVVAVVLPDRTHPLLWAAVRAAFAPAGVA